MTGLWLHAEWLPALIAVWLLAALAVAASRLHARRAARRLLGPAAAGLPRGARGDLAVLVALALVAAALLGLRLGERTLRVPASGVDVVLLLDVSRSMDAQDVPPSRLARARRAALELLAGLEPGDRAALAAFAGRGVLLTPLTSDHAALAEMVPAVDTDLLRPGGSALAEGVRAALDAFEPASARPRVLVVLGDGEDPGARGATGVPEAVRAEARVVAVTLGTARGAPVPDGDTLLRDAAGRTVHSRRNEAPLAALASATGGTLIPTDDWGAVDTAALRAVVRRDAAAAPGEWVERRVRAVQVMPLALGAFLLLALEAALAGGPRTVAPRRERAGLARLSPAAPLALLAALGATLASAQAPVAQLEARATAQPGDAPALLRLGIARARTGRIPEAQRALLGAALLARSAETAALAWYDLGVTALEARELAAARDAFFEALAAGPRADGELERAARFNLEWTLRALAAKDPPALPAAGNREAPPDESGHEQADAAEIRREPAPREPAGETRPPDTSKAAERAHAAPAPPLAPEEAERWLRAVEDDPARALRLTAREPGDPGDPRRGGAQPSW